MRPGDDDLWLLPLGGCGEIGMNLNLYGHAGQWLMVDCGITFARPGETGPHVQMPDPAFIASRREQLQALIVTHAHEDHVGAVAHLWPQLQCPVYVTRFCRAILERKLREAGLLNRVPLKALRNDTAVQLGPFRVEPIGLTHSTPETQALLIETAVGRVFHTADWKLDPDPVVGATYSEKRLKGLAVLGIDAMVCDSTNALTPGRSTSEGELSEGIEDLVRSAPGRVVIACFGSNVARLATIARVAERCGRYPGLIGRSLHNYYAAARAAGLWNEGPTLIDSAHLGYLPREETLAIATGSQGEPRAALDRLAADSHPDLSLESGDRVVFSSRVIPGNEDAVERLCDRLQRLGVDVVHDTQSNRPIHASGHPAQDELRELYQWVDPAIAIPVHGEAEHLEAHRLLARELDVSRQLVGRNGDLFMIKPTPGIRRGAAPVGRLGLDRGQLQPLSSGATPASAVHG
ncbi:MAG: ribonuclease J [Pseudomonadota bacterium]